MSDKEILDLAIAAIDALDDAHIELTGAKLMGARIQIREQFIYRSLAIIESNKEGEL